jgi:hypothetical protein
MQVVGVLNRYGIEILRNHVYDHVHNHLLDPLRVAIQLLFVTQHPDCSSSTEYPNTGMGIRLFKPMTRYRVVRDVYPVPHTPGLVDVLSRSSNSSRWASFLR